MLESVFFYPKHFPELYFKFQNCAIIHLVSDFLLGAAF